MDEYQKHEIYLNNCGSMCPFEEDETECPYRDKDEGVCLLDEPWFDCNDFMAENAAEIQNAEFEIGDDEDEEEEDEDYED